MDYGHSLEFGTFITPQNRRPEDVVALARLTERVGLDLVSFQDHPYQSAFTTDRISVAGHSRAYMVGDHFLRRTLENSFPRRS
jgi:hypothetical protein